MCPTPTLQLGRTALSFAKTDEIKALLRAAGAMLSLHEAAQHGYEDDVAAHIAQGADVNAEDKVRVVMRG